MNCTNKQQETAECEKRGCEGCYYNERINIMEIVKIDFEKYLQHNGQDVFKIIKTKTNKYMLVDLKTNKIVASTKNEILKRIKEWGEENEKELEVN